MCAVRSCVCESMCARTKGKQRLNEETMAFNVSCEDEGRRGRKECRKDGKNGREKRHEWMFIEIMRTACSFLQMLVYY